MSHKRVRSDVYMRQSAVLNGVREHAWSTDDNGIKVKAYCIFCGHKQEFGDRGYMYWPCCAHCKRPPYEHVQILTTVDGVMHMKCLFEPTNYREMTCEEYYRFSRDPDRADLR